MSSGITNSAVIDASIDRFEEAWNHPATCPPDVRTFLPSGDAKDRAVALTELLRVDMERRWHTAERQTLADYLREFPELSVPGRADLAFEEYRILVEQGEDARPEDYQRLHGIDTRAWPRLKEMERDTHALRSMHDSTFDILTQDTDRLVSSIESFPVPGDVFGDFRILEPLGEGKFSRVFLTQQGELADRKVVLKVSGELWSESEKLARLQHTHIVPVYSIHRVGPLQAICMPYLGRDTLDRVLRRARKHDARQRRTETEEAKTCRFFAKLADALDHAHRRGILHRDLKPANVLVSDEEEPLILDFNLSENLVVGGTTSLLIGGTLPYMAPEHLQAVLSRDRLGPECDVYSLGVMLYEMLVGELPFARQEGNFLDTVTRMIRDRKSDQRWQSKLRQRTSPDLATIVEKSLAPEPAARYATAGQLCDDLQHHAASRPLQHARNASPAQTLTKWVRRHRHRLTVGWIAAAATILLTLAGLVAVLQFQRNRELQSSATAAAFGREFASLRMDLALPDAAPELTRAAADRSARALAMVAAEEAGDAWHARSPYRDLADQPARQLDRQVDELRYLLQVKQQMIDRVDEHYRDLPMVQAIARMRSGEFAQARHALTQATQDEPSDPVLWLLLGNCQVAAEEWSLAEESFTRCLALAPDSPVAYFHRGLCRMFRSAYDGAVRDFSMFLKLRPQSYSGLLNRAICFRQAGKLELALADIDAAIASGQPGSRAYLVRSEIHAALGESALAEADRLTGISILPRDADGWAARGEVQIDTNVTAAIADLEKALRLAPAHRGALQNLSHIYADVAPDPEKVSAVLEQFETRYPNDPLAPAARAVLAARDGQVDEARSQIETALARRRDAATYYQVASALALLAGKASEPGPLEAECIDKMQACLRQEPQWFGVAANDPDFAKMMENKDFRRLLGAANVLWQP